MSNPSVEVPIPQEFKVYAQAIELRIAALEQELARLKQGTVSSSTDVASSNELPWWVKIAGSCADNPLFEEAVCHGREWRNSVE
jgi:uncharacterized small protein (DUF1192 family)